MIEFEKNKRLRRNFSYTSCIKMIKILNISDKTKFLTKSKVARSIGVCPTNPPFNELINYLKEIKVITEQEHIGINCILKIDKILLKNFIDEQEVLTWLAAKYLKKWCTGFKW